MRIIYFVQYFIPEKASGLELVNDLIESFIKNGFKVDLYTPIPTRGISKEIRKKYSKKPLKIEHLYENRLTIHRMSLWKERKNPISRTIRYLIFSFQCLIIGLIKPADLIFAGSGPPTMGFVGGLLSKITKKKFVYNVQDIFPDSLLNSSNSQILKLIIKIGKKMEYFSYKNSNLIITISNEMKNNISNKTENREKIHAIKNWVNTDNIIPIPRVYNRLFDKFNLDRGKFYVTYAGNIGYAQGIEYIIEGAKLLTNFTNIEFILIGNGSEEDKIAKKIVENNILNVKMFPLQNHDMISEVYSLGNVSIVASIPGTGKSGMPSKTGLIMSTGTPIVGLFDDNSEFNEIINESKSGYSIYPNNSKKFAEIIKNLYFDEELCKQLGKNAREYSKLFMNKESSTEKYISLIRSLNNS